MTSTKKAKRNTRVTKLTLLTDLRTTQVLALKLASAAIYMQPRFKETELFKQFAESEAGKLLSGEGGKKFVDRALSEVHTELLQAGLVSLTDDARVAIAKDSKAVLKEAAKNYLAYLEGAVPEGMRDSMLPRMPEYIEAKKLVDSMK